MKTMMKKTISALLVFVICFGMVFGINMSVYAASYIYNWGERGTTATYLSTYAEDFYADNNTSYGELASLPGSSSESGVPSSALYKQLHNLMESNQNYQTTYDSTKDLFKYTDCQNGGGKISSFYSGTLIGPNWDGSWNREHTWPNSKGDKSGNGENDLMMLRPTSTSENSSRGNKAYGQSSSYYNPNSESNGKYDLRGDVARIVLYVYVRWECTNTGSSYNPNGIFGVDGVIESKEVMLDWIEQDPVDTWELGRNDAAESILGTRNVFVDYPELAFLLYNEEIPTDYTTPSGNADAVQYTITAQSNNTAWGTVSVSGRTVNATPATGYEVVGYELISGEATVTRSGNAFGVSATDDVAIQINFAPRSQKSVKFLQNGVTVDTQTVYSGDQITLPEHSGEVPDGNTFVGWAEQAVGETTTTPKYYTAGSKYTVYADMTLYALYSKSVNDGGSTSNIFEKYSGALTPGDYIVTYEGGAMKAAPTGANRLQIADIDDSGNDMTVTDSSLIWKLDQNGDYWTFYNESTGKYAAGTGTKNTAKLSDSVDDFAKWTASGNSTYEFVNLGNDAKGVNPLLRKNPGIGFACYAKNTNVGGPLSLYKRISGTVYYFTGTVVDCDHSYSSECDEQCDICSEKRETNTEHQFGEDDVCINCNYKKIDVTAGDVNSDGSINNKDLSLLMQYLNDWEVSINIDVADVNVDGGVNNRDYSLLMQYINGWDVELGGGSGDDVVQETDPALIMEAAYALQPGEDLGYEVTLEGKVTGIKTAYDAYYENISVVMEVASKELVCYRMVGDGIADIIRGDIITVTGTIKNYSGTIEFDTGCTMRKRVPGETVVLTDSKEIVDAAFALEPGESLGYAVTLTGKILEIDTPYDATYNNITVIIEVTGSSGTKELTCYRMKGDGADTLQVGDTITVTGIIKNYQHSSGDCEVEFDTGCTFTK